MSSVSYTHLDVYKRQVIVLHEKITFLSGLGIVLVLGGLLLSEQKKKLFLIRGRKHTENVVE